ncbi:GatB/YqeY domain-containing protein [Paraphaeosphaeria sporulosa]|uniref:Altered inheritance of mitochondria protein 41 n=1 Tax=Paraphaeosphaeria sporulosa TaxID=1460663 RepID=A0A177CB45_9PLEO|nr:GatB/YqeY domain-containing protein [Paraphaeosphaeria sporulosa]OAG03997.1 GatB/YqeY domain-containing protein [Paraphaeosphaeria sporulosa]
MSLFRLARFPALQQPLLRRTFLTTRPLFHADTVVKSLKPELMTAMRAKDKPRLTVLRALLAEITNASKTNKPVDDDPALYSLLAKQIKASNAAVEEFVQAKREDLVEKERGQILILEGFLNQIEVVPEQTIRQFAEEVVAEIKGEAKTGAVMGKVMKKIGGKPVDMVMAGRVVEEVVAEKSS